jgi:hypothetical protein
MVRVLHCLAYPQCFGVDPVTTTVQPDSFDLKIVNILN